MLVMHSPSLKAITVASWCMACLLLISFPAFIKLIHPSGSRVLFDHLAAYAVPSLAAIFMQDICP